MEIPLRDKVVLVIAIAVVFIHLTFLDVVTLVFSLIASF